MLQGADTMGLLPLRSYLKVDVEKVPLPTRAALDGLLSVPLAVNVMPIATATRRARHVLAGLEEQNEPLSFEDVSALALIRATRVIAVLLEAARFHPPHNATPINLVEEIWAQASLFLRLPEWEQRMYLDEAHTLLQHLHTHEFPGQWPQA
jgi:hypothetical protein